MFQQKPHQRHIAGKRGTDERRLTIKIHPVGADLKEAAERRRIDLRIRIGAACQECFDQVHRIAIIRKRRSRVAREIRISPFNSGKQGCAFIKVVGRIWVCTFFQEE